MPPWHQPATTTTDGYRFWRFCFFGRKQATSPCGNGSAAWCARIAEPLGVDIKTAQFGWAIGMPLIRKHATDLWEVRSRVSTGIARVIFTVEGQTMVLLHGFGKKSQRTPPADLMTARRRLAQLRSE